MSDEPRRDRPVKIRDACLRLNISRSTLYLEVRDGKLHIIKIRGGSFVMESEIERYLKARAKRAA